MSRIAFLCVLAAAAPASADEPAYKLDLELDVPAITIAGLSTTAWFFDLGPAYCAPRCDPATVNAFDRPFAGRYAPGWTTAGTATAVALLGAPPLILFAVESPKHAANDTVVLVESVLVTSSLGVIFETGVRRPRPFLYGDAAPLGERNATNASLSFFSGHTADVWAATIATWRTLDRLHVAPRWQYLVLGIGLAGSAFVGISRVVSGDHFPTDVLVGAGVGASLGFAIPALHAHGIAVAPSPAAGPAPGWVMSAATRF